MEKNNINMRKIIYSSLILLVIILNLQLVANAQIKPLSVFEVNGKRVINITDTGNAHVKEEIKFSAQAYIAFKKIYNPISTFIRELEPKASPTQIENLTIKLDDASNKLTAKYDLLGKAIYKGNGEWEVKIAEPGDKLQLTSQNGNTLIFTNIHAVGEDYKIMETITVNLPSKAKHPVYHEDEGTITYTLSIKTQKSVSLKYAGLGLIILGIVISLTSQFKRKNTRDLETLPS